MSMQISNSMSLTATTGISNRPQQLRSELKDLRVALRSGDLDAASSAYAALASDAPKLLERKPDGAFAQIGKALAAGDLAGAQSAFATMVKSHLPQHAGHASLPPMPSDPAPSDPVSLAGGGLSVIA
jgi:hypothetical protein